MRAYNLTHLADDVLLRDLTTLVTQDRSTTALVLAHIAEVDARKLYLQAGHPSMFAYCVEELRLSEGGAYKRILAARAARQFPCILAAVADGRLHLTAVRLLAPFLTAENVDELLASATHLRRVDLEQLLAQRFPPLRPPAPKPTVRAIPSQPMRKQVLGPVASPSSPPTPSLLDPSEAPSQPTPPKRYSVHVAIEESTHDKLRYAQQLLSHALPSGDVAQVLDRALDALISQLEKRKFAATDTPRSAASTGKRYVPARIRRAVWARDGGRCTFISHTGHRCGALKFLEYDHVDPVARGGTATMASIRLLCRAHNQYEAEQAFGPSFMARKREEARAQSDASPAKTPDAAERPQRRTNVATSGSGIPSCTDSTLPAPAGHYADSAVSSTTPSPG